MDDPRYAFVVGGCVSFGLAASGLFWPAAWAFGAAVAVLMLWWQRGWRR